MAPLLFWCIWGACVSMLLFFSWPVKIFAGVILAIVSLYLQVHYLQAREDSSNTMARLLDLQHPPE